MMDRYSLIEKILMYVAIAVFLTFILLPFFEMFMTSLRPMDHLRHAPYKFWSDELSFSAYRTMWTTVPKLPLYIFNGVFIASAVTAVCMIFVIPAAYAYARFEFKGKTLSLSLFLAVNMFAGAVLLIPLSPASYPRSVEYVFRNDRSGGCLLGANGYLVAKILPRKNPARTRRSRVCGWCEPDVHASSCDAAIGQTGLNRRRCFGLYRSVCTTVFVRDYFQPKSRLHAAARRCV